MSPYTMAKLFQNPSAPQSRACVVVTPRPAAQARPTHGRSGEPSVHGAARDEGDQDDGPRRHTLPPINPMFVSSAAAVRLLVGLLVAVLLHPAGAGA